MSEPIRELRALAADVARADTAARLLAAEFDGPAVDDDGDTTVYGLIVKAAAELQSATDFLKAAMYEAIERRTALAHAGAAGGEG